MTNVNMKLYKLVLVSTLEKCNIPIKQKPLSLNIKHLKIIYLPSLTTLVNKITHKVIKGDKDKIFQL